MSVETVVILKKPIEFGSQVIDRLVLREPTAKDIAALKSDMTLGDILEIGRRLCDQPKSVMEKLSVPDTYALAEQIGFLLDDGR